MKESKIFLRTATGVIAAILFVVAIPVSGFWGCLTTLCFGGSLYLLQQTYQKRDAAGKVFYSFLLLSMASTICLQVVVFFPLMWITMVLYLGSFSLRCFSASVLGLLCPYWFLVPCFILTGNTNTLLTHLATIITDLQIPDYTSLSIWGIILYAMSLISNIACAWYFYKTDTQENIHQRMSVNSFLLLSGFAAVIPIVQPQLLSYFIGMMLMGEVLLLAITLQKVKK